MIKESVLSHLNFSDLWNPSIIAIAVILSVMYLMVVGPMRNRFLDSTPVSRGRKTLFLLGLLTFYLAVGSPLRVIGHHFLFSAHIMQQSLLFFVMPPLLLLGTPAWLIRPLLQKTTVKKMLPILTQPLISVFLFNVMLSFYHFPIIFDTMMNYPVLGALFHVFLTLTSFQMWWLITCPVPELERLSELKKMAYIVVNGILLYPACAVLIFAGKLLYEHYAAVPQLVSFLDPEDDQQFGGVIMKLMQEGALVFALAFTFFRWYRKEKEVDDAVLESTISIKGNVDSTLGDI